MTGQRDDDSTKPKVGFSGRKIIYDEDGKPCRSCNSLLDFQLATGRISIPSPGKVPAAKMAAPAKQTTPASYPKVEPPDVEELGRSSWTLLHSIAAKYPQKPNEIQKGEMKQFMTIFSHVYPCWWCAKDFEKFIRENSPKVDSREELGRWMCEAHNSVNEKLGKKAFDCNLWEKRWKDGWD
ncbi:flavin-linked sulfhydryl oxidase [Lachancea thermotolerans CBS 6340]|uniref:Sulfhydryl oxidase n=1 Tax=Lachancea thermotolerans (strain ATCC 56472 / CBS 6340 / NRRL Y-8284) TaxID=559295 RepID=C5DNL0_LACTC|nr:KLTH0G17908p [Lachancea thermotolerans CBS 6340]CAR25371.1 KLTH0G17908p [Lachancea thermotolerans CBS 6340]